MPKVINLVLAGTLALTAALVSVFAIPMLRGRVRPNRLYGVRIPAAFRSDAHWYAMNRFGARAFLWYAVGLCVFSVVALFIRHESGFAFWTVVTAPLFLLIPVLWAIFRYGTMLPAEPERLQQLLPEETAPGGGGTEAPE